MLSLGSWGKSCRSWTFWKHDLSPPPAIAVRERPDQPKVSPVGSAGPRGPGSLPTHSHWPLSHSPHTLSTRTCIHRLTSSHAHSRAVMLTRPHSHAHTHTPTHTHHTAHRLPHTHAKHRGGRLELRQDLVRCRLPERGGRRLHPSCPWRPRRQRTGQEAFLPHRAGRCHLGRLAWATATDISRAALSSLASPEVPGVPLGLTSRGGHSCHTSTVWPGLVGLLGRERGDRKGKP